MSDQYGHLPPVSDYPQHRKLDPDWTKPPVVNPKLYQRKWFTPVVASAVALAVGFGMGASDNSKPAAAPAPVVKVSPSPVASPSPVPVTPQSCKAALEAADTGFGYAKDGFEIVARAFDAVSTFDTAALSGEVTKLQTLQPKLASAISKYTTLRDECQAAG